MYVSMWLVIGMSAVIAAFVTCLGVILIDRWWMRKQQAYTMILKGGKGLIETFNAKPKNPYFQKSTQEGQ